MLDWLGKVMPVLYVIYNDNTCRTVKMLNISHGPIKYSILKLVFMSSTHKLVKQLFNFYTLNFSGS